MSAWKNVAAAAVVAAVMLSPAVAAAHQPRLVDGGGADVPEPEISKAYYGELGGHPAAFTIQAPADFDLYVNLLVPAIRGARMDMSAVILKDGQTLAVLNGSEFKWQPFHEEFAGDDYLKGPEYRSRQPAGKYEIRVSDRGNSGKYVLAIGEKESFPLSEVLNSLKVIPVLKTRFFERPTPAGFALSIIGGVALASAMAVGALLALASRLLSRFFRRGGRAASRRNIGLPDRLARFGFACGLLAAGLFLWSPVLQLLAGFVLFEAVFSWCALYSIMGKNTCPMS